MNLQRRRGVKAILERPVGVGAQVEYEDRERYHRLASAVGLSFSAWQREAFELYAKECEDFLESNEQIAYEREVGLRD